MNSNERNCDKCVYGRRSGNCTAWNCKGTVTVEDIKAEARQSAIDEFANKLIDELHYNVSAKPVTIDTPYATPIMIDGEIQKIAEQLKENNNG